MNERQIQRLIKNWSENEVKTIDEACQIQLNATQGKVTEDFMEFAKETCIKSVRMGLRNPY